MLESQVDVLAMAAFAPPPAGQTPPPDYLGVLTPPITANWKQPTTTGHYTAPGSTRAGCGDAELLIK